ncbi:MAG: DUF4317 domain-containing protein [Lachnospiraceae bacterium]|nr:DUF4317 domain-containing protein [Lachnospiraceae bacterium]
MDKKAVSEIRKILGKDHCRVDRITGCFVGEDGEIITNLKDTFLAMPEEDLEKYCEIFRKTLSGKLGKNLYNMEFPIAEELDEGKQVQLYRLLRSDFTDPEMTDRFLHTIIENLDMAGRYLIILAKGNYDIPAKTSDGADLEDASDYVYMFLLCCICPVTEVKEGLCFDETTLTFVNKRTDLGVQMPELGFLFPAFNDRLPDIHSLLYYAKKEDERHPELIDGIIGADIPVTETAQKELFSEVVEQALGRDCSFDNVKAVTEAVNEMIKEEKDNPEPLELGKAELRRILDTSGAPREVTGERFDAVFDEQIGEGGSLSAENIGGRSVMEIRSPSIKISVKSDMSAMITTRILDGMEYLLIPVQDDVELNGIRIRPQNTGR